MSKLQIKKRNRHSKSTELTCKKSIIPTAITIRLFIGEQNDLNNVLEKNCNNKIYETTHPYLKVAPR